MSKNECINELRMALPSYSVNESAARAIVSAFCAALNPTASEISDIRCAVSEAVTNCAVHAYRDVIGTIFITVRLYADRTVKIEIKDKGCGISDIPLALSPLYTTDPEGERSGMGFTVMENFTDSVNVRSTVGKGTKVTLKKRLSQLPVKK